MAGAACGLFVSAHVGSTISYLTSQAFLLFMMFNGSSAIPPANEFMHTLLFTRHGAGLMVVGTAVGAALAALTFAVSAVSVPLLLVKDVDIVTAITTSIKAVDLFNEKIQQHVYGDITRLNVVFEARLFVK